MQYTEVIVGGWEGESNTGFVTELLLIDINDLLSIIDPEQDPIVGLPMTVKNDNLNIQPGTIIYRLKFPSKACSFSERQTFTNDGKVTTLSIDFDLPKNDFSLSNWLYDNLNRRWLTLFRDGNGLSWIFGDNENGLSVFTNRSISSSNRVSVQLTGFCSHQAWHFENFDDFVVTQILNNVGNWDGLQNSGFVTELLLIDTNDIDCIIDPMEDPIEDKPMTVKNGNVLIKEGIKISRIRFRTKSCTFNESQFVTFNGKMFSVTIAFDLPKNSTQLAEWLRGNLYRRWVALFRDGNGNCFIAGDCENGLKFLYDRVLGNTNATRVQLTGQNWHLAWHIESVDISMMFAQFSDDFNDDFFI